VLGFKKAVSTPKLLLDSLPENQFSWIPEQQDQQLHRNPFQLDRMSGSTELTALYVQLKFLKPHEWLGHVRAFSGPFRRQIGENK
jgi:hypothetical protein